MLLHGVVGEVDHLVHLLEGEEFGGGADVALLVPVALDLVVDHHHQEVASDVELPLAVQVWLDVALNQVGVFGLERLEVGFDTVDAFLDGDAVAPVGELSGLDDPEGLLLALGVVGVVHKSKELGVGGGGGQVEGDGYEVEGVLLLGLVVGLQVLEEGFLVGELLLLGEVVGQLQLSRLHHVEVLLLRQLLQNVQHVSRGDILLAVVGEHEQLKDVPVLHQVVLHQFGQFGSLVGGMQLPAGLRAGDVLLTELGPDQIAGGILLLHHPLDVPIPPRLQNLPHQQTIVALVHNPLHTLASLPRIHVHLEVQTHQPADPSIDLLDFRLHRLLPH